MWAASIRFAFWNDADWGGGVTPPTVTPRRPSVAFGRGGGMAARSGRARIPRQRKRYPAFPGISWLRGLRHATVTT